MKKVSMRERTKILFVCHGNICRSPMAEFILKEMVRQRGIAEEFHIESAAVSTEEIGNGIYPPAKACLTRHGIPFSKEKRARQVTPSDYAAFDHIICMDTSNLRLIKRFFPADPEHKIRLMMSYANQDRSVADPWYTNDFETTYQDLHTACTALLNALSA